MIIVLLGPPGAGKGTQAKMLQKHTGIISISTGDELRKNITQQTQIGKLAKSYMDNGKLVPDEVVINIIKNIIYNDNSQNGFILDGFPRTINQAIELDNVINFKNVKIDKVFNFEVDDEEVLIKRISGRISCKKCGSVYNRYFKLTKKEGLCDDCGGNEFESRLDDNEETVKKRLQIYYQSSFPLIDFYKKKNLLVTINANNIAPLIFKHLLSSINLNS